MKLKLKNDAGMTREVPTGVAFWGALFTGFTMMTRGMLGKGLVYMILIYGLQSTIIFTSILVSFTDGQEAAAHTQTGGFMVMLIPNVLFFFKLNKWTVRHWLDRGYKPVGEGWEKWGPKIGVEVK